MSDKKPQKVTLKVDPQAHKRAKLEAQKHGVTLTRYVSAALNAAAAALKPRG